LDSKYRVERVLGAGGVGMVVRAVHIDLERRVAIKFMHARLARDPEAVARFMREGRAAARLKSEHVCQVLNVERLPTGEPYLVMEYLEGSSLESALGDRGPLPLTDAMDYVLQACEAIAEAHAIGIVHRDLKPANLFLAKDRFGAPCVKVLDFGISKMRRPGASEASVTQTGAVLGSPMFMSPGQIRSARDVDARADV